MGQELLNERKRPLGITLLSIFHYICAIVGVFSANLPFPIFGKEVHMPWSPILWIGLAVICLFVGYGLWTLRIYAWLLTISVHGFSLISISVYYLRFHFSKITVSSTDIFIGIFSYSFSILVIVYLLKRRVYFLRHPI